MRKEFPSYEAARDWVTGEGYTRSHAFIGGELYEKAGHRLYLTWPGMYQKAIWTIFD